jgi:hypothetical protein
MFPCLEKQGGGCDTILSALSGGINPSTFFNYKVFIFKHYYE